MNKARSYAVGTFRNVPGVREHCLETGEKPPKRWCDFPVDMLRHGGYLAVVVGRSIRQAIAVAGPFCWYENAQRAAGPLSAIVVPVWFFNRVRGQEVRRVWRG